MNIFFSRTIQSMALAAVGAVIASPAFAQITPTAGDDEVIALGAESPRDVAVGLINIALGFVAFILVALFLYGGFLWMTSAGNDEQVGKAKNVLISAVIGLLILMAAWGITLFVISVGDQVTT